MKRPGGVTPPPPEQPVEPAAGRSPRSRIRQSDPQPSPAEPAERRGRRLSRSRPRLDRGGSPDASEPEAITEPIVVQAAAGASAELGRNTRPQSAESPSEAASAAPLDVDRPGEQLTEPLPFARRESIPPRRRTEETAWWRAPRHRPEAGPDAEKELVIAERRRRRYERAEARRFTQSSRIRRRRVLIGTAVAVVLVLLVVLTAYSPLLAVRTIAVEGTSRIDAASVSAALSDQLGRPLSLVDFGEVKTELATFPLIQSYVTESRPPSTLVVKIVERQPVVSVAGDSGFDLLDPAGVVVEKSPERAPGYPLIDVTQTPVGSTGFVAASTVLLALAPGFRAQLDSVSAATPDSVLLVLSGSNQRVLWGSAEDSALKARILATMLAQPATNTSTEFDVSSPDAPVVR